MRRVRVGARLGYRVQADRVTRPLDPNQNLGLDWYFARQCARANDLSDVRDLLEAEFARLGFPHFCYCVHGMRPRSVQSTAWLLHNFPLAWEKRHIAKSYLRRDPIFAAARRFTLPFRWDDPDFLGALDADQLGILAEAREYGIARGVTIPLHGPEASVSCALVAGQGEIDSDKVHLAQHYALYGYEAARRFAPALRPRPSITLTRRERQCMELVALGKDDEAIAMILGIDRETVRCHVESAKRRLGATKRSQAVAYAIYARAIRAEDLFD